MTGFSFVGIVVTAATIDESNDFSNLSPRQISFRTGGLITAVIGIISFPWKLYEDVGAYIFTWLVGYGSLLASFLAVMVFDHWLLRRTRLDRGRRDRRPGLLRPAVPLRRLRPFAISAVTYVALSAATRTEPSTAAVTE